MPHLTVTAYENEMQGNEDELISALTDAVTDVYGEWARELVIVVGSSRTLDRRVTSAS